MKLNAFSKTYKDRTVLTMPELELEPGKIYGVIGTNGSGKSTLAKVLAGIEPADGNNRLFSERVSVGYMPQRSYAFRMSALANIWLAGGERERAEKMMRDLRIDHLADQRAGRLSGGELARVALARVMMKTYDLLVLDEPTTSMDMEATLLSEALIVNCCKETGCALVLVTHSLQQASRVASEILFLHNGVLAEAGPTETVFHNPKEETTKQFLMFYGAV